jgi:hypothetical protein
MFTWICPKCGREVPPSYSDCPDCATKAAPPPPGPALQPPEPPRPQAPPPAPQPPPQYQPAPPVYQQPYQQQPQYQPQPPQYQQQPPQYQQQPPYPPPPYYAQPAPARRGLPTWLMSVLFALAFGGVVLGAYFAVQYFKKEPSATAQSGGVALENPPTASANTAGKGNPLWKQIEVVGLRLTQNKAKKTEVRFLVVNHSAAEIQDLAANVNLQARTSKAEDEPVGTFSFKIPLLGPYESKEMTAVVNTKLKVYELPDWQNLQERVQITSP